MSNLHYHGKRICNFFVDFFGETMIWKFPLILSALKYRPFCSTLSNKITMYGAERFFLTFFLNQSLSNTTVGYAESLPINWALASTFSGRNRTGKVSHGRIFGCGPGFHFTWWILLWLPWWNARDKLVSRVRYYTEKGKIHLDAHQQSS